MPKLVRVRYDRKKMEAACRDGTFPEPEAREVIGKTDYNEVDLDEIAWIFFQQIKKEQVSLIE